MMSIKPHSNSTLFLFEPRPDNPGKRQFLNLLVGYYELITHNTLAWIPVYSVSSLKDLQPTRVTIMNIDFVVWFNNVQNEWCVASDVCPHRLAPLSQGRVNEKSVERLPSGNTDLLVLDMAANG